MTFACSFSFTCVSEPALRDGAAVLVWKESDVECEHGDSSVQNPDRAVRRLNREKPHASTSHPRRCENTRRQL